MASSTSQGIFNCLLDFFKSCKLCLVKGLCKWLLISVGLHPRLCFPHHISITQQCVDCHFLDIILETFTSTTCLWSMPELCFPAIHDEQRILPMNCPNIVNSRCRKDIHTYLHV